MNGNQINYKKNNTLNVNYLVVFAFYVQTYATMDNVSTDNGNKFTNIR